MSSAPTPTTLTINAETIADLRDRLGLSTINLCSPVPGLPRRCSGLVPFRFDRKDGSLKHPACYANANKVGKVPLHLWADIAEWSTDKIVSTFLERQRRHTRLNHAVVLPDGLLVIECDSLEADAEIAAVIGDVVTPTRAAYRPGIGRAWLVSVEPGRYKNRHRVGQSQKADVKSRNGYLIASGTHRTGHAITWDQPLLTTPIAQAPSALIEWLDRYLISSNPGLRPSRPQAGVTSRASSDLIDPSTGQIISTPSSTGRVALPVVPLSAGLELRTPSTALQLIDHGIGNQPTDRARWYVIHECLAHGLSIDEARTVLHAIRGLCSLTTDIDRDLQRAVDHVAAQRQQAVRVWFREIKTGPGSRAESKAQIRFRGCDRTVHWYTVPCVLGDPRHGQIAAEYAHVAVLAQRTKKDVWALIDETKRITRLWI